VTTRSAKDGTGSGIRKSGISNQNGLPAVTSNHDFEAS